MAEFDLTAAAFQCLAQHLGRLERSGVADPALYPALHAMCRYGLNTQQWRARVAEYYGIGDVSKKIFTRIHLFGSRVPDPEWGSACPADDIPCLIELKSAAQEALRPIMAYDPDLQRIAAMPSIRRRRNPLVSAWAIYVQGLMH